MMKLRRIFLATTLILLHADVMAEIIGQPINRAATDDQTKASLRQVEIVNENGQKLDLANGKPSLVTLWAHWCPNCRAEMNELKALASICPDRRNVVYPRARDYAKDLLKFKTYDFPWRLYNVSPQMMSNARKYEILRAFLVAATDGGVSTPLHHLLTARGLVQAVVNARMDFAAPERTRAFCAG